MGLGGGRGVPLPLPAATFPVSTLSLRAQDGTLLLRKLTVAPFRKASQISLMASIASP